MEFAMLIGHLFSFLKDSLFCGTKVIKKPIYLLAIFIILVANILVIESLLALSLFNFLQDNYAYTTSICSLYTALAFLAQVMLSLIMIHYLLNKNTQKDVISTTTDLLSAFMKGFNRS
jgi:hypothetical protein